MPIIGSAVYSIFGLYGLFYFGPIATIILLIISERITTKLFGNMMGLVTLLFLATSESILYVGRVLLTDNFFTIFFILGIYYLIKFYREKKQKYILITSIFFAFSSIIRINGMISIPIELGVISIVLFNHIRLDSSYSIWKETNSKVQSIKNSLTFIGKITIPWLVVIIVIFSYHMYFFIDSEENLFTDDNFSLIDKGVTKSLTNIEPTNRLENILSYANSVLPSPMNRIQYFIDDYDDRLDEYYPIISLMFKSILLDETFSKFNFGIISLAILGITILISIKTKQKYFEIILYSAFIFSFFFVFSKSFVVDRYMIPVLPLFFTILGYLILKPFNIKIPKNMKLILVSKISVITIMCIFFVFAFYLSEPMQILKIEGFDITNPSEKANRYPLDNEGVSKNSIVLGVLSSKTLDYDLIPFNPIYKHPGKIDFDQSYVLPESINLIKNTMKNGYNFYSFKDPQSHLDKPFLRYLVENYDFILKDHSSNFCKVEIDNGTNGKSDENCFEGN